MKEVDRSSLEKAKAHAKNVYEAVIITAKRSRQLNEERLAQLELMPEDDSIEIDNRKVTEIAIKELADGQIKVEH